MSIGDASRSEHQGYNCIIRYLYAAVNLPTR